MKKMRGRQRVMKMRKVKKWEKRKTMRKVMKERASRKWCVEGTVMVLGLSSFLLYGR